MNRLFIVVLISLSTLLFACSDESSSNSSEGADRANDSSVVDDNDAGDDMDEDTGDDMDEDADDMDEDTGDDMDEDADGAPSGGGAVSAPSGGGAVSGGGIGNPSDEIDARNEAIQQDLNTGSQPDTVNSIEVEPIDLSIDNDDGNSLDSLDN